MATIFSFKKCGFLLLVLTRMEHVPFIFVYFFSWLLLHLNLSRLEGFFPACGCSLCVGLSPGKPFTRLSYLWNEVL